MDSNSLSAMSQKVLDIQDACNFYAVAMSFADALKSLRSTHNIVGDDLSSHPIVRLYLEKMCQLSLQNNCFEVATYHDHEKLTNIIRNYKDGN